MNRRNFSRALLGSVAGAELLLVGGNAVAQQAAAIEGKDFKRLDKPLTPSAPGKIEVLEFFSYGCNACHALEPQLAAWARTLPADVLLRRVPVGFLANAQNFQRTFFALETMGLVESMQASIFAAVHVERHPMDKPEQIAAMLGKRGVDAGKFLATFNSFSAAAFVSRAKKMSSDYGVESIPTLAVQGRFTTSPSQAGGGRRLFAVLDTLIERARKG